MCYVALSCAILRYVLYCIVFALCVAILRSVLQHRTREQNIFNIVYTLNKLQILNVHISIERNKHAVVVVVDMPCCAMLRYILLCCPLICYVVPRGATFCYVVECRSMLRYVLLRCAFLMLFCVMLCYVMRCCAMLCFVALCCTLSAWWTELGDDTSMFGRGL